MAHGLKLAGKPVAMVWLRWGCVACRLPGIQAIFFLLNPGLLYFTLFILLYESQFSFRKHRSAELALPRQKQLILDSFKSRNLALCVLIDLSKAFDSLDNTVLRHKLCNYGIRGAAHSLLASYLNNRLHHVVITETVSTAKKIYCGRPLGSMLIFLIFISMTSFKQAQIHSWLFPPLSSYLALRLTT